MGAGGAKLHIEGSNGFKGSTNMLSMSNSAKMAGIGHGSSANMYLAAEDTRQHMLEAEHLSNSVELNVHGFQLL